MRIALGQMDPNEFIHINCFQARCLEVNVPEPHSSSTIIILRETPRVMGFTPFPEGLFGRTGRKPILIIKEVMKICSFLVVQR